MLYINDNAHLVVRRVAKFHAVTPFDPKVIGVNTLHFKPIMTPLCKNCKRTPILGGVRASKIWTLYSFCKNFGAQRLLGAKIWYFE